ncbi:undecaprenyl-phosphate glucose phosphotransferase [Microbulbifer flavimaris]|uniref:Undecaprenyl-phosphate glucose phosphotransferase n=1 Tax=Microbulbifer flavimaris TaxID=1781068 RepID=A0ABX4I056_9GAMM|nr:MULTISPECIES: undecaprenyl-phosphate glucose phosphotransferase [Microbulbifer]KUJ82994.1 undecaprenyl-phosphate glucose phosphotransferase [Microbulbifer sp. ZGT114]PCO05178.1 undecaprenyl-phosphate glucose phosphotransferase [Microbulbifer flavimaris]
MQQGWIRAHQSDLAAVYRLIDGVLILAVLGVCLTLMGEPISGNWAAAGLLAVIAFVIMAEPVELYRSWRTDSFRAMLAATAVTWVSVCLLLLLVGYFSRLGHEFSRLVVGCWFLFSLIALGSWRFGLRRLLQYLRIHDRNTRSAAILGITPTGLQLAKDLEQHPELGIRLQGFYRISGVPSAETSVAGAASLLTGPTGQLEDALAAAHSGELDLVYIALPISEAKRIGELLAAFGDTTATVHLLPDIFGANLLQSRWHRIGSSAVLSIYDTPIQGINGWLKRLEDVVIASLALVLLSPLMLLIAIGVKLSSKGPVIFRQRRYGYCGNTIEVWKFRSMTTQEDGAKVVQATRNDPRVTRFGGFLRRTSLDELPQFINVLRGEMSIVGPRPHAVAHNEQYRSLVSGYMLRHKVKPGITGWAQVNGWRGETDTLEKMSKRVEYDLDYIRRWSIFFDCYIVLMTVFKGFKSKNAY